MCREAQSQEGSIYEPLLSGNSFRLIHLHAGLPETAISCTLEVVDESSVSEYEAISYVWGKVENPEFIVCNGTNKRVAPNLGTLLRHLRSAHEDRLIWIDALSINQADLAERSQQVPLMKQIFGGARSVVAWLRQDHGFAESSIEAISICAAEVCKELNIELEEVDYKEFFPISQRVNPGPTSLSSALLPRAMRIISLPWFTRVWITQEAAHQIVHPHIGNYRVDWYTLRAAAAWLNYKHAGTLSFEDGQSLHSALSLFGTSSHTLMASQSLVTLMLHSRLCSATDARNKVFALVGLLPETNDLSGDLLLQPDYTKDIVDVYADMTHCLLKDQSYIHNGALGIMTSIGWIVTDLTNSFPSWIPRLDQGRRSFSLHQIIGRKAPGDWQASLETLTVFRNTSDRRCLIVEGLHIGTVAHVDESLNYIWEQSISDMSVADHLRIVEEKWQRGSAWTGQEIRRLWYWTLQHFGSSIQAAQLANMFARTITASARKNPKQPVRDGIIEHGDQFFFDNTDLDAYLVDEQGRKSVEPPRKYRLSKGNDEWDLETAARDAAFEAVFFVTGSLQMGLGTKMAQPGDYVCVLYGGATPFLLRPINGHYRFLGPCYVDGWMHGEAIRKQEAGEINKQWFDLW